MKRSLLAIAVLAAASMSMAQTQPIQGGTITGDGGKIDNQLMGDTSVVNDHSQSSATQTGNSTNAIGNDLGNTNDVRNQNTVNAPATATGGTANGNQSDNKSTASNGPQTMGQANTGNSSATTGASTSSTGAIDNTSKATGGAGGGGGGGGTGVGVGLGGEGGKGGTVAGSGNSKQGQGQQQGIAGSGNSRNSQNTSAGNGAGAGAGAGAGSGNQTVLDASNHSRTEIDARSLYIPAVVPATPPSIVPSATIQSGGMACGPMQQIVRTPVNGTFHGFFSTSETPQGWTDDLAPYMELHGRAYRIPTDGSPIDPEAVVVPYVYFDARKTQPFGVQVMTHSAVVGVSGARNIALGGGGGSNMNWGQAGGGASSGSQRMVTTIQLRLCAIEVARPATQPTRPTIHVEKPIRE